MTSPPPGSDTATDPRPADAWTAGALGSLEHAAARAAEFALLPRGDGPPLDARLLRRRQWTVAQALTDAVALGVAVWATTVLPGSGGESSSHPGLLLAPLVALLVALLVQRGLYAWPPRLQLADELRAVAGAATLAAMVAITLRALLWGDAAAAPALALAAGTCGVLVAGGRAGLWTLRTRTSLGGGGGGGAVIVGAGRIGQLTARRLLEQPSFGLRPIGFVDDQPPALDSLPMPVLGSVAELEQLAARHGIDHVIVAFSSSRDGMLLGLLRRCSEAGLTVSVVPRLFELDGRRAGVTHLGGLPLIRMRSANPKGWQFAVKYALDRLLAALLLIVLAPLMAVVALAVRRSLGSPVLFRQRRIGMDGRQFDLLKFRTMTPPAATGAEVVVLPVGLAPGGVEGHDRRTRLGALLRRTALDELPQLINVLRGEMSLVGPRPERPEFVELFNDRVYRYDARHRVRSGMTGWAQVHGLRGRTSVTDRAELDNHYIENWSLWLDVVTLLRTIPSLMRSRVEEWPRE